MSQPDQLSRPRTIVVASLLAAAVVAGGVFLQRGTSGNIAPPVRGATLFDQVHYYVANLYFDTLPEDQLYRAAIDGMVSELGDPYNAYLTPDRLKRLSEQASGSYAGIGLQVDVRDGMLVVVNPLPGGPGERAGIVTGDRIIEIDGKVVRSWTPDEVQRLLRGRPNTTVSVTIEHPGNPTPVTLSLQRELIQQRALGTPLLLPNQVGYVAIRVFSDSTAVELRNAVDQLLADGARSLLLDVRGNPGGLLERGVAVADLFLDSAQQIVSVRGRVAEEQRVYVDSTAQPWPKLPVAVLVDSRSASAAELFAGALQDNDRAAVLGLPTFGKGSVQTVFPLKLNQEDGSVLNAGALKLTTARWYTPLGRSIARIELRDDEVPPKDRRPGFKTPRGRTVLGGGGIIPDVEVGDTIVPVENLAFMQMLGKKAAQFRDALASYALSLKASRAVTSQNFVVSDTMLAEVYTRMQARGADVPRSTYDEVKPLVSRLLAYEISRYVFGPTAEQYRKAMDDPVIARAQQLLAGIQNPQDLVERATRDGETQRESAG